ncbi:MAG TPA: CDP-glycerol glycerophosphotransferase family protein [Marmoricola sp.]|nr:CDP-glycerol glycerophosphotransferase family protein [Marmoricola sp.]
MPAKDRIRHSTGVLTTRVARSTRAYRLARRLGRRFGDRVRYRGPSLSVVVPVYNVREWITPALESLVSQSLSDLEIIVVDDGSTDGSMDIVRDFARRDPRIQIFSQQNAGLGAARNAGLVRARGEFLAFFDSDDLLLPGSYEAMVQQLRHSGSDFVTASFARGDVGQALKPNWVSRLFARDRTGLTVAEEPWLLLDITAWNKVFRRSFWDRHGFRFVEGVRYEDQVPITSAYLEARSIDVLRRQVYIWRTRPDGSSITQQKASLADLSDRLLSQEGCASLVHDAPMHVRETWYVKLFDYDLPSYLAASFHASAEYRAMLRDRLSALRQEIPDSTWMRVAFPNRTLAWLLSHGELDLATRLRSWFEQHMNVLPTIRHGEDLVYGLPFSVDEETLPIWLRRVYDVDVRPVVRLVETCWEGAELVLRGSAFLSPLAPEYAPHELAVHLVEHGGDRRAVPVRRYSDVGLDHLGRGSSFDTSGTGFEARIDADQLARTTAAGQQALRLELVHRQGSFEVTSDITHVVGTGSGGLRQPRLCAGRMVRLAGVVDTGHVVLVHDTFSWTTGHRDLGDGAVELELCASSVDPVTAAFLEPQDVAADPIPVTVTDGVTRVRLTPDSGRRLVTRHRSGLQVDTIWGDDASVVGTAAGGFVHRGTAMTVVVGGIGPAILVSDFSVHADHITLKGTGLGAEQHRLYLRGERADGTASTPLPPGAFEVDVPVLQDAWSLGPRALPHGRYGLAARPPEGAAAERCYLHTTTSLRQSLPVAAATAGQHLTVGVDGLWNLQVDSRPLPPGEETARHQEELRTSTYRAARLDELQPVVLFETFGGAVAGDSPAAIARELVRRGCRLDLAFTVADGSVHVPDGTRPVRRLSAEWYELLARARYLVNNNNFPFFFEKAPGQAYLQTWHGTPLKRINLDIEDKRYLNVSYLQTMDREAGAWDALVSPSPFCSDVFPRAFGYSGRLLEAGYPRNDDLLAPEATKQRYEARARLGLEPDQQVLLYAPTWRDSAGIGNGVYNKVLHLDPEGLARALPGTVVLVRGHVNTARSASVNTHGHPHVQDVTLYPDINDLFLASDALVTDYSSVMFDYVLLDRPMLFLVPDLADYRDRDRGFYFDFEADPPGPLVSDQQQLVAHLRDDSAGAPFAPARARFRERFAPWDDGAAAARVVDAFFGELDD